MILLTDDEAWEALEEIDEADPKKNQTQDN